MGDITLTHTCRVVPMPGADPSKGKSLGACEYEINRFQIDQAEKMDNFQCSVKYEGFFLYDLKVVCTGKAKKTGSTEQGRGEVTLIATCTTDSFSVSLGLMGLMIGLGDNDRKWYQPPGWQKTRGECEDTANDFQTGEVQNWLENPDCEVSSWESVRNDEGVFNTKVSCTGKLKQKDEKKDADAHPLFPQYR